MVRVHVNTHGRNGPNNSASLSVSPADADAYICIFGHKKYVEKVASGRIETKTTGRLAVQATLSSLYAYIRQTRLAS
jgi:hypothetical protein